MSRFANDSDEPSWIVEDATLPSDVTRFVSGVEGDFAVTTSTTGDRVVQLVEPPRLPWRLSTHGG